jgi:hypothetical protein
MSIKHEVSTSKETDLNCPSDLSGELNQRLDDAYQIAKERFDSGHRTGGFGAVGRYFLTFVYTGLVRAEFLRGRRGLIACSVAAQDAYNRAVMSYCILAQKK